MTTTPTESDVKSAFETIIRNHNLKAVNYAVNYAHAGLEMTNKSLRVQCLYVLNNITSWRGEVASEVRLTLKRFCGIHVPKPKSKPA